MLEKTIFCLHGHFVLIEYLLSFGLAYDWSSSALIADSD